MSVSDGLTIGPVAITLANVYTIGEQPILSATFSDPTSTTAPTDPLTGFTLVSPPSALALVRLPDGSEITPTLAKSGTTYSVSLPVLRAAGTCWYRVYSPAGTHCGASEFFFRVRAQRA